MSRCRGQSARGGRGGETLIGGGSADRFVYTSTNDSNIPGARDFVADFSRAQGDKIDLATIDAKALTGGNQAFSFIGQAQFTGEGQLRFYQNSGATYVEANTDNATAGPELVIVFDTLMTPKGFDFFL